MGQAARWGGNAIVQGCSGLNIITMKEYFHNIFYKGEIVLGTKKGIILTGGLVGLLAVILTAFGNPANMGLCIVCFIRDTAGGLGFHRAGVVQYIRPEIIGLTLGGPSLSL